MEDDKKKKVTATDIKLALKNTHASRNTYFITECKTCSTYFPDPQGLLKFDGLAITKSYTKPCIIGYEIKVSRNDFLRDNKWHLYLQYCNEFYFVVPYGLVSKEEIPDNVGLIYYNPEKDALRTIKKALYRQIEKPVGVYEYIIFSRLEEDRLPFYEEKAEYARAYLEDQRDKRYIGSVLGSTMAKDLEEAYKRLEAVKHKEIDIERWEKVEKLLRKHDFLGWNWYKDDDSWLEGLEKALSSSYPKELEFTLDALKREVNRLEKLKEECNAND